MRAVICGGLLIASSVGCCAGPDAGESSGKPITLTRGGEPIATIVLAKQPTRAAEFAAAELRYHIERITGAALPVRPDDEGISGPRVLVGESAATREIGFRADDLESQEYLIRFLPDTLVLMGRDRATPDGEQRGPPDPAWSSGKFGKALSFDGVDDAVAVLECGFLDEVGTMEAWIRLPDETQEKHGTILRLDGRDPWTYHIVQRLPDSRVVAYVTYDGTKGASVRSPELAEGWHHVMATHSLEEEKIELFIDGVSQGTAAFSPTTCNGAVLGIGGVPARPGAGVGNPFRGRIDEVRISTAIRRPDGDGFGGPYAPDAHTTLLHHFDEGEGRPQDASGRPSLPDPPGWFEDRGTLDAVYDFLERFCRVRWYAPTEVGIVHPTAETLTIRGADIRRAPAMRYRWMAPTSLYMPTPSDKLSASDVTLWKLRMRLGGESFAANHSFYGYYDRFLEDHPDWFAQGYEGKPPQMCFTHSGFIDQVVQDARDYFDGKGARSGAQAMGDSFALVPMDNGSWCKCENCQARLDPAEMENRQFTNGKASNLIFGFVNDVARQIAKTHPDKYIAALAYADYAQYPTDVDPEPNVAVMMCLTARHWWAPGMKQADLKMLNTWVEKSEGRRPLYLWLYYCFPALNAKTGRYNAFPGFFAQTVARQMRMYHEAGIRGIFLEHSSEMGQSYLLDQLELYLTWKLADDPALNADELIDEFFSLYYGPAARPMKELHAGIEEAYTNPDNYPEEVRRLPGGTQHQNETIAWASLGTAERMAHFGELMNRATAAATAEPYRQRVALFRAGIWDYMVEGRRKYAESLQ